MSPRSKRRRTGDRCHGTGCGQPDCGDCHRRDEDAAAAASSDAAAVLLQHDPSPSPSPPQPSSTPSPGLAAMIAALEEKALRDLLLQSAASSQEIQRSIKDAYHRQAARPQPPPLLPQPLLTSHLMMQQAKAVRAAAAAAAALSPITPTTTTATRLPAAVPNTSITTPASSHHQQQTRPVTNFDHYSKSAWHALHDRPPPPSSSPSGDGNGNDGREDPHADVCACVSAIDAMTRADSPLGTKQNALEALRAIARAAVLAGDGAAAVVVPRGIADVMVRVAESMTPEERLCTGRRRRRGTGGAGGQGKEGEDGEGEGGKGEGVTLVSGLEWLRDEAEARCLGEAEGFGRVLELLRSGFASPSTAAAPVVDLTQ